MRETTRVVFVEKMDLYVGLWGLVGDKNRYGIVYQVTNTHTHTNNILTSRLRKGETKRERVLARELTLFRLAIDGRDWHAWRTPCAAYRSPPDAWPP